MFDRVTTKALPLANRYGEYAPQAAVCCNACRTCVQTNVLTAALGVVAAAGAFLARRVPRLARP